MPHAELSSQLRYSHYPSHIGSRTTIKYCLEYRRYSKTIRNELATEGITVQRAMDRVISGYLGTNRFLLITNNDDQTDLLKSPNVIRLSGSPHGSNDYDNERYFVFLSALNRSNPHESMLVELGLSKTMIRHTTTIEAAHQAAMRTNLRVPTSNEPVHIIVPDRDTANALGKILGCTNISRLDGVEPQAKSRLDGLLPLTSSDRNRNSIAHKVEMSLLPHKSGNGSGDFSSKHSLRFALNSRRNSNDFWSDVDDPDDRSGDEIIHLLFHENEKVAHVRQLDPKSFTPNSLRIKFEELARKKVLNKEDVMLFNPCIFKVPEDGVSIKRDQNFLSASCLVLDFDNGSFSPDDFIRLLWSEPGDHRKRSFIICNTFSRSEKEPNRFRVIIPFQRPVMAKDVFQAIYDQIVDRLVRSGFTKDELGLDPNSRSPSQSFYVPCTNRHHPGAAFCDSFGMGKREFNRYALDPQGYEQTLREADQKPRWFLRSTDKKHLTEDQNAKLREKKFELMSMKSNRNPPFFSFGGLLENLNFSIHEIDVELSEVAGSDPKMIKKKNDFLKRVTKNRS